MGNRSSLIDIYQGFLSENVKEFLKNESEIVDIIHKILCESFFKGKEEDKLIKLAKELAYHYRHGKVHQNNFISLVVPYYNESTEVIIRDYFILFSVLENIYKQMVNAKELDWKQHERFMLFDPFMGDNTFLHYSRSEDNQLVFGQDEIFVETDQFIPLFLEREVSGASKTERATLGWLFFPIVKLAREAGIDFPIVFDLISNKTLILTSKKNPITRHSQICCNDSVEGFLYDVVNNSSSFQSLIHILDKTKPSSIIQIEWPYHRFDESRYERVLEPKYYLEIKLKKRFNPNLVKEFGSGLMLLPGELTSLDRFYDYSNIDELLYVVKTKEFLEIVSKLDYLKETWENLKGDSYDRPFPVKWLTLLNTGKTLNYWERSYENTFPSVPATVQREVKAIISIVLKENWLDELILKFIEEDHKVLYVLLPRGRKYKSINRDLQEYLSQCLEHVQIIYIEHYDLLYGSFSGTLWILDTSLSILFSIPKKEGTKVIIPIPDFHFALRLLYKKVQMLKMTNDVLLGNETNSSLRRTLLTNEQNSSLNGIYNNILQLLLKEAREKSKFYRPEAATATTEYVEVYEDEDEEVYEEEAEQEFYATRRAAVSVNEIDFSKPLQITLNDGTQEFINPLERILINHRCNFINAYARELKPGDVFAKCKNVLSSLEETDDFLKSWTKFPYAVNEWKKKLKDLENSLGNVYERLSRLIGPGFIQPQYFESIWLNPNSSIKLPLKRQHWDALCIILNIDNKDCNRAWIAVKSEQKIEDSRWRAIKNSLLNVLAENGYLGQLYNMEAMKETVLILDREPYFKEKGIETRDVAEILLDDLIHALSNTAEFKKVEEIISSNITEELNAI
ncbi:hypothetical protein ABID22_000340 [Pontibacter aydingkolensis]|uniref:Uncharacterized protein n=1 Tax=Pontibacter aydingkolensis TaxID=1911536 RepID=A0ABS7CQ86_9BACT|nr:hypothetical protein [Pontibacter aydingkolensis]MBW7465995.1 hypothetical protein [Pontibacter aydingkolensis]